MPNLIAKLRGIPIWVRVSGIVALVLVGVVISSMLLGGSSAGGHEGSRDGGSQMDGMDQMGGMDHNRGQTEPVIPSADSQPAENPTPSGHQMPTREGRPSDVPDGPTATPSHSSGDHPRSDGSRDH